MACKKYKDRRPLCELIERKCSFSFFFFVFWACYGQKDIEKTSTTCKGIMGEVGETQACCTDFSTSPKSCGLHKEYVSVVPMLSACSMCAAWLLEMRKLDNQTLVCVDILWVLTRTPHVCSIHA